MHAGDDGVRPEEACCSIITHIAGRGETASDEGILKTSLYYTRGHSLQNRGPGAAVPARSERAAAHWHATPGRASAAKWCGVAVLEAGAESNPRACGKSSRLVGLPGRLLRCNRTLLGANCARSADRSEDVHARGSSIQSMKRPNGSDFLLFPTFSNLFLSVLRVLLPPSPAGQQKQHPCSSPGRTVQLQNN
jgi:hypothetical protein